MRWCVGLLLTCVACTTEQSEPSDPPGPYQALPALPAGEAPAALSLGDFDRDGALDLVVANHLAASASLYRGGGDGSFAATGTLAAGEEPRSVASADFDGDGDVDIVVANRAASTLSVYLNAGDGAFGSALELATGARPTFVAARDLNHDGQVDLLVTNADDDTVSVFLADGSGPFAARTDFATGTNPVHATVVDLNADGVEDVVTANRSVPPSVSVLLGDGLGGFGAPAKFEASNRPGLVFPIAPATITSGDVDEDGDADVVVGNRGLDVLDGEVWLLAGDGSGSLAEPAELPGVVVLAPAFIELTDLNGDGHLDVIEADHDPMLATLIGSLTGSGYSVCIAHGDGLGAFQHEACLVTGDYPHDVDVGLLNADATLDLVVANAGTDDVSVFLAR